MVPKCKWRCSYVHELRHLVTGTRQPVLSINQNIYSVQKAGRIDSSKLLAVIYEGIMIAMRILGATYWAGGGITPRFHWTEE